MINALLVFGTRPEAIKMLPLAKKIHEARGLSCRICVTAQHREMLDQVMNVFNITADYDLNLMREKQTPVTIINSVLAGVTDILISANPDIVLVHGDTSTSFSDALASFMKQIPVGHVEAGLRTDNIYSPFPEEMNRRLTAQLSTIHFAPSPLSVENLRKEGVVKNIYQTGNTIIDALKYTVQENYVFKNQCLRSLDFDSKRVILLTAHRRENWGIPLNNVFISISELTKRFNDIQFVYPVHKNPLVSGPANRILGGNPKVCLLDPIDVEDMHNLMKKSHFIMTDSGGLQEEAPALGRPVLVLRTETERPEVIESGNAMLVGIESKNIIESAQELLINNNKYNAMSQAVNPYGNGDACEKICSAILEEKWR